MRPRSERACLPATKQQSQMHHGWCTHALHRVRGSTVVKMATKYQARLHPFSCAHHTKHTRHHEASQERCIDISDISKLISIPAQHQIAHTHTRARIEIPSRQGILDGAWMSTSSSESTSMIADVAAELKPTRRLRENRIKIGA